MPRNLPASLGLAALVLVLSSGLVACGDDDDDEGDAVWSVTTSPPSSDAPITAIPIASATRSAATTILRIPRIHSPPGLGRAQSIRRPGRGGSFSGSVDIVN